MHFAAKTDEREFFYMKSKKHRYFKARVIAAIAAIICIVFAISGCKVELPDEAAEPSPEATEEITASEEPKPTKSADLSSSNEDADAEEEPQQSKANEEKTDGAEDEQSATKAPQSSKESSSSSSAPKKTKTPESSKPEKTPEP